MGACSQEAIRARPQQRCPPVAPTLRYLCAHAPDQRPERAAVLHRRAVRHGPSAGAPSCPTGSRNVRLMRGRRSRQSRCCRPLSQTPCSGVFDACPERAVLLPDRQRRRAAGPVPPANDARHGRAVLVTELSGALSAHRRPRRAFVVAAQRYGHVGLGPAHAGMGYAVAPVHDAVCTPTQTRAQRHEKAHKLSDLQPRAGSIRQWRVCAHVASTATDNVGRVLWTPYLGFIYSVILQLFSLPVGSNNPTPVHRHPLPVACRPFQFAMVRRKSAGATTITASPR